MDKLLPEIAPVVRAADGAVTRADGSPLALDAPTSILAGMPSAWREILAIYDQYAEANL